jgi:hypothetical protein
VFHILEGEMSFGAAFEIPKNTGLLAIYKFCILNFIIFILLDGVFRIEI